MQVDSVTGSPPPPVDEEQLRKPFVGVEHGLDAEWRLTKYSDLKG